MITAVVRVNVLAIASPGPQHRAHEVRLVDDDSVISPSPGKFLVAFKADSWAGDLDASEQRAITEARRVCELLNVAFERVAASTRASWETLDNRGAL